MEWGVGGAQVSITGIGIEQVRRSEVRVSLSVSNEHWLGCRRSKSEGLTRVPAVLVAFEAFRRNYALMFRMCSRWSSSFSDIP